MNPTAKNKIFKSEPSPCFTSQTVYTLLLGKNGKSGITPVITFQSSH